MQKSLILLWRKMKRIKLLKPLNRLIFVVASSNMFNVIIDFAEVYFFHNKFIDTRQYFLSEKEKINSNFSLLSDDRSKKVYKNVILYRMTHNRKYMKDIMDEDQYFDRDIVVWSKNECMVDGGAFDGDTIERFKKIMEHQNTNWSVVAFEPDVYNCKMLKKAIMNLKCEDKVKIYNLGLWSEKAKLNFQSGMDDSSRLAKNGETTISVDTIEHILGNRKVTFIKMDVEGAELNSLKGAKAVILRDHPKLAISIYHSDQDMVEIIDYLAKEFPFYSLYVRHYTCFFADTLCYAIDPNIT